MRTIPAKTTEARIVPASSPEHEAPPLLPPSEPQLVARDHSPGQRPGEGEEGEDEDGEEEGSRDGEDPKKDEETLSFRS